MLTGFHVVLTEATGDFATADVSADVVVSFAGSGGTLHLEGAHRLIDTATGMHLVTDDFIRISPSGVVNDTLRIVEGGTGLLHTHGSVDLATGVVTLDYRGRVCT